MLVPPVGKGVLASTGWDEAPSTVARPLQVCCRTPPSGERCSETPNKQKVSPS